MRPSQVAESIELLYAKRRPGFIWGPPGAGKSDVMHQVTEKNKLALIDVRLSMLDPTDLKGFAIADREKELMRWFHADFLPRDPKSKGILFFDEANAAPKSVEAPMYQLTLDRKLGDYRLPDGWSIMLAGNRETDRAIANRMSSALQNRLVHINYEIHTDDWRTWAIQHGIGLEILGFIALRPDLLHKFDPDSKGWPSPRSWTFANDLIHSGLSPDTEFELLKGTVGEGAAGEFEAFVRIYRDLPTIEEVLAKAEKIAVPTTPNVLYALVTALAAAAVPKNFDQMMKFIRRIDLEYQVVFIRDSVRRETGIDETKSFTKWSIDNAEVLG